MNDRPSTPVGPAAVLALASEVILLAALAFAGWQGADALPARIALMIVLPGLVIAMWGVWMAPRSPRRLPTPWRSLVQILLFVLAGAAVAAVGEGPWGLAVGLVGLVDVAILARRDGSPAPKVT